MLNLTIFKNFSSPIKKRRSVRKPISSTNQQQLIDKNDQNGVDAYDKTNDTIGAKSKDETSISSNNNHGGKSIPISSLPMKLKTGRLSQVSIPSQNKETISKAAAAAKAFLDIQNTGIYSELLKVTSPKCLFQFGDTEFLLDTWIEDAGNIGSSYPDFHLSHEKIIDISPTQAMIVNLQASGTHSGTPYAFGPYPEIPATGIHCKNDYEDVTVTIDAESGMILCMKFVAKGPATGPPGFYNQIGGIFF
jgi:hypothetical protein